MTPLLFAAWEKFAPVDFVSVLKVVSVISFRYSVVSGLNTNALEPVYHQAARAVLDGMATTPAKVFDRLKPIFVDDKKFKQDFTSLQLPSAGQHKKLAKYIFSRLEADASGRECDPETDSGTIEHVLPENPLDDWAQRIPREQWDAAVYRLGNLSLLEPSLNRRVANKAYGEKLAIYAESVYRVTSSIADLAPEDWTVPLIERRQSEFAKRAVHLWRVDFA
jgi:hypothetical protein